MAKIPSSDDTTSEQSIDPGIEAMIGAKLRAYYDSLQTEPVPEKIVELLLRLEANERLNQENSP